MVDERGVSSKPRVGVMRLTNESVVPASLDEVWAVLLDVARIAPCLPGASIEAGDGDEYRGTMKVRLGPITSSFQGTICIEEADWRPGAR